ncbi:MAG: UBP-type zinc finger domain-containing protein, partial [Acidobacteriota bacterium]|nr:UBP-type zinc finger domain-containing protein [Acidobacteriota bacterium]
MATVSQATCPHVSQANGEVTTPAPSTSCAECGASAPTRGCLACGHVGCCDSTRGHATVHAR